MRPARPITTCRILTAAIMSTKASLKNRDVTASYDWPV